MLALLLFVQAYPCHSIPELDIGTSISPQTGKFRIIQGGCSPTSPIFSENGSPLKFIPMFN
jgi:hypothetical protein